MEYKFNNGKIVEVKDFDIETDMEKMFKVNLPDSLNSYVNGNGEGVWACGDKDTLNACQNDEESGIYFVKILNDSTYYPPLNCYTLIPVEMRGEKRPTAIFRELQEKYGESHREEVIERVIKAHQ